MEDEAKVSKKATNLLLQVVPTIFQPIQHQLMLQTSFQQVPWNTSSLLLKNISQNTPTQQLFTMNIKTESIYKS
jgi:hypothetical protein